MSENIFRVTVDEYNYSRNLGTPVEASLLEETGLEEHQGARFWAQKTSEKGKQVYDAMGSDDGLLFYKVQRGLAPDEGQYVGVGRIGDTVRLESDQAETLFQTTHAQLAYTVTEFEPIAKSITDIEQILGYSSYPQSSHRVTDNRYSSVDEVLHVLAE